MTRKKPKKNRLDRYLHRNEISQQEFADAITELRGWTIYQSAVSRWVTGRVIPNHEMRDYIAQVTDGQVPADCW